MNTWFSMGVIAVCTSVFVGVVALLVMQGVNILLAVLGVYLFAVWTMLSMQRTARDNFDGRKIRLYRDSHAHRTRANNYGHAGDANFLSQE